VHPPLRTQPLYYRHSYLFDTYYPYLMVNLSVSGMLIGGAAGGILERVVNKGKKASGIATGGSVMTGVVVGGLGGGIGNQVGSFRKGATPIERVIGDRRFSGRTANGVSHRIIF